MATTYTLISSTTLTVDTASITLSAIPQTFTDLSLRVADHTDAPSTTDYYAWMRFNGSSSSVYSSTFGYARTSTANAGYDAVGTFLWDDPYTTFGASAANATLSIKELYIPNYTLTGDKVFSYDYGTANGAIASAGVSGMSSGLASTIGAITSITMLNYSTNKFIAGTTVQLYGIKNS